ncbi:MAG: nickel-dependent lactate racemase [Spirochaetales bacterium]|nr:nickel-dependent lactate racemase [Spirochaetales bacterium]
MNDILLKHGKQELSCTLPKNWDSNIIDSIFEDKNADLAEMVKTAMQNPVGSEKLERIVKPGETVCIVFSDITRSWQRTDLYLPVIVEELENAGINSDDITLLCGLGTHRKHTEEEKKILTGSLYGKYKIIDHDCDDLDNIINLGTTVRGTSAEINRIAVEADRLILTGGIVFHLMAGYSAGRKSIIPGISSRKTILENHALSLAPQKGMGSNPEIGCDKLGGNPVHEDMMEIQELIKPDFIVNIIPGKDLPGAAVAGDYLKAHEYGCKLLRDFFRVPITEKKDVVIASAGGFPADINFYQSVKSLINASQALNTGGTLILVSRCNEGLGNPLMEEMLTDFSSMAERETFLRNNYSIGRFIAYYGCELASKFTLLLVTDMEEPSLEKAGIHCCKTLEEAIEMVQKETSSTDAYIIPDASHTFPALKK